MPEVFATFKATMHIPRQPVRQGVAGDPDHSHVRSARLRYSARVVLVGRLRGALPRRPRLSCRWTPDDMIKALQAVVGDQHLARETAASGLETIHARHTCAHRVDELIAIASAIRGTRLEAASSV